MYLCKYSFLFSFHCNFDCHFPVLGLLISLEIALIEIIYFALLLLLSLILLFFIMFFFCFFLSHHLCLYKYYLKPISRTTWKTFVDFKVFLWFILCDMFILIAFCNYHGLWIWSVVICCVYGAFLKPDLSRVNRGNNWKADSTPFRDFNKLGAADS